MSEKFPMTPSGYAAMKAHLVRLKNVDRPANSRAIEIARGHGDLSENAEYDAAKNEQAVLEDEIAELEEQLRDATIVEKGDRAILARPAERIREIF